MISLHWIEKYFNYHGWEAGKPSVLTILNLNFFHLGLIYSIFFVQIKKTYLDCYIITASYVHDNDQFFVLYFKSFVNTVLFSINIQIKQVVVKVEGVLKK